jgi:hypothetical protein
MPRTKATERLPMARVPVQLTVGTITGIIGWVDAEPRDTFTGRLADMLRAAGDHVDTEAAFQAIVTRRFVRPNGLESWGMTTPRQGHDSAQTEMADHARDTADATVSPAHRDLLTEHGDHSAHGQGRAENNRGGLNHATTTTAPDDQD